MNNNGLFNDELLLAIQESVIELYDYIALIEYDEALSENEKELRLERSEILHKLNLKERHLDPYLEQACSISQSKKTREVCERIQILLQKKKPLEALNKEELLARVKALEAMYENASQRIPTSGETKVSEPLVEMEPSGQPPLEDLAAMETIPFTHEDSFIDMPEEKPSIVAPPMDLEKFDDYSEQDEMVKEESRLQTSTSDQSEEPDETYIENKVTRETPEEYQTVKPMQKNHPDSSKKKKKIGIPIFPVAAAAIFGFLVMMVLINDPAGSGEKASQNELGGFKTQTKAPEEQKVIAPPMGAVQPEIVNAKPIPPTGSSTNPVPQPVFKSTKEDDSTRSNTNDLKEESQLIKTRLVQEETLQKPVSKQISPSEPSAHSAPVQQKIVRIPLKEETLNLHPEPQIVIKRVEEINHYKAQFDIFPKDGAFCFRFQDKTYCRGDDFYGFPVTFVHKNFMKFYSNTYEFTYKVRM